MASLVHNELNMLKCMLQPGLSVFIPVCGVHFCYFEHITLCYTSMTRYCLLCSYLTHWGRVTHKSVGKLTSIGSDNGLWPGRRQAIIWTNGGILLIEPLGTNFSENLLEIHTFSFKKMHLKMSSGKWRPFCLGLNVLIHFNANVVNSMPDETMEMPWWLASPGHEQTWWTVWDENDNGEIRDYIMASKVCPSYFNNWKVTCVLLIGHTSYGPAHIPDPNLAITLPDGTRTSTDLVMAAKLYNVFCQTLFGYLWFQITCWTDNIIKKNTISCEIFLNSKSSDNVEWWFNLLAP